MKKEEKIMSNEKLTGADYLLILLYLDNCSVIKGAIRLMKMMFLFEKEIKKMLENIKHKSLFNFEPFNFGPFSKEVYQQIEFFSSIKFISVKSIDINDNDKDEYKMIESDDYEESIFINEMFSQDKDFVKEDDYKFFQYKIESEGIRYVESEIFSKKLLAESQRELLAKFKQKINSMTPQQILKYVYTKYPEYTTKSKIKNKVLKNE